MLGKTHYHLKTTLSSSVMNGTAWVVLARAKLEPNPSYARNQARLLANEGGRGPAPGESAEFPLLPAYMTRSSSGRTSLGGGVREEPAHE